MVFCSIRKAKQTVYVKYNLLSFSWFRKQTGPKMQACCEPVFAISGGIQTHKRSEGYLISSEAPRTEIAGSWRKIKHLNLPRNSRSCGLFGTCNPPESRRYRVSAFFLNILAGPIEFQRKELEFRIEIPLFQAKNHPFGSAWKKPCSAAQD